MQDITRDEMTVEDRVLKSTLRAGFFKKFIFGILYGLAIIIPGLSGAAIAIVFKLYDELVYSVGNIFKHFKKCFTFVLPIVLGLVIGFVLGFFAIQKLLDILPFSIVLLFIGLMAGSFPAVYREIKGNERSVKNIIAIAIGVVIPIVITIVSVLLTFKGKGDETSTFTSFPWYMILAALPIGIVVGMTQVVPGLSATAFLMMIGYFKKIMNGIHISYIKENPLFVVFMLVMIVGFIAGFILTSKIVDICNKKNRKLTYQVVVGLSIGSLVSMLFNPEMISIYLSWNQVGINTTSGLIDVILALPLFVIGFISAFMLVRYEMKKRS